MPTQQPIIQSQSKTYGCEQSYTHRAFAESVVNTLNRTKEPAGSTPPSSTSSKHIFIPIIFTVCDGSKKIDTKSDKFKPLNSIESQIEHALQFYNGTSSGDNDETSKGFSIQANEGGMMRDVTPPK